MIFEASRAKAIDKLNSMTLKTIGPVNYKNYHQFDKDYSCFLEFINDYNVPCHHVH